MWILALDVGTSSIRAVGYDALGWPLPGADARVGCEPTTTPGGGSELDPEELVAATASAIDRCLAAALLALGAFGRPAPAPELSGTPVHPDPRRRDIYAAARARQSGPYDSVVGPRVS